MVLDLVCLYYCVFGVGFVYLSDAGVLEICWHIVFRIHWLYHVSDNSKFIIWLVYLWKCRGSDTVRVPRQRSCRTHRRRLSLCWKWWWCALLRNWYRRYIRLQSDIEFHWNTSCWILLLAMADSRFRNDRVPAGPRNSNPTNRPNLLVL